MLPKTIHYCWFGGAPLPKTAQKCVASWKEFFPGYEIKQWDESNYDVNKIPYISEAYRAKKYAFVSDFARFDILYHSGGIYFDTDVEVIKGFEDLLSENPNIMGCEIDGGDRNIKVNPGIILSAEPQLEIYGKIIDYYKTQSFINGDGSINTETVVTKTTAVLLKNGLENKTGIQNVCGITVYPKEYFNPLNANTGKIDKTENTRSIHWYDMSWLDSKSKVISRITRIFHRIFGENCFAFLRKH